MHLHKQGIKINHKVVNEIDERRKFNNDKVRAKKIINTYRGQRREK